MNCQNCNAVINYNYVTDCPQCGCALEGGNLPKVDRSIESVNKGWPYHLVNVVYVLMTSAVGMMAGAVVMYFGAAVIYIALQSPDTVPGENCARGMAIGMLSILTGGFLGTAGGAAFGVKRPISQR